MSAEHLRRLVIANKKVAKANAEQDTFDGKLQNSIVMMGTSESFKKPFAWFLL